ncbi:MAG: hypothetical protein CJD30_01920 [Sulfuricurvum sp. PD_MW2]|jgi:integrase|uniref:tyrosine-type recombinase/integrase n=1 Tax=Sulfuricurvum sp. PD_MW2 TaxID=2027917 RepID=UPI000C064CF4|nr:MAG: hypothetical protein CJD30_01920 [Sulfuricurvum sp. PD_MW2]
MYKYDQLFNQGLTRDDWKNRVCNHTLRHTFASHLAINQIPLYEIKKLMNHRDINMTLRYAKLAEANKVLAVVNLHGSLNETIVMIISIYSTLGMFPPIFYFSQYVKS